MNFASIWKYKGWEDNTVIIFGSQLEKAVSSTNHCL